MSKLVIHVGPGKCGSSSIQGFFKRRKRPCVQKTRYIKLDPIEISKLNHEIPEESAVTAFTRLLSNNLNRCDVLILSSEFFFKCPSSIKNICKISTDLVSSIVIIGYSRRQSDFLVSAYHQWGFREQDRVKVDIDALINFELDPILFTGLERHLIASIVNDFYSAEQPKHSIQDWSISYQNISQLADESRAIIKCGVLPGKGDDKSLIQDFCEKSDLTLKKKIASSNEKVVNVSFNHDLIEAMNNSIFYGLEIPDPHTFNNKINKISTIMSTRKNVESEFLTNLKAYIDTFFWHSNNQLCEEYCLSKKYFCPSVQLTKSQILDIIKREGRHRASDSSAIINHYRMLSAQMATTCFDIMKHDWLHRASAYSTDAIINKYRMRLCEFYRRILRRGRAKRTVQAESNEQGTGGNAQP